jgi:FlaA1/EpsC-like NDP-sugar epimerase
MQGKSLILKYRRPLIVVYHFCIIALSYYLSFLLKFDFMMPPEYRVVFFHTLLFLIAVKMTVFYCFGLYGGMWRYVSIEDFWQIFKANALSSVFLIAASIFLPWFRFSSRPVFIIDFVLCLLFVSGSRFATRLMRERFHPDVIIQKKSRTLILGAGKAGILTLKESRNNDIMGLEVVGFVDDDPVKKHQRICGVQVLGGTKDIPYLVKRYDVEQIILAIPSARGEIIRKILSYCEIPSLRIKIVPPLNKILSGDLEIKPREINADDLLGRETVEINNEEVMSYIKNKRILVTGAGGSIGSELCRQIVRYSPKEITFLDRNENDVYFLIIDFKTKFPDIKINTIIGDIQDIGLLKQTFRRYKPQVIFHAAAHKHVPLMQDNPIAAVKNNIMGSRNLIYAANHYKVERFVLISTDKAVNPINIMGMSKRIAEMILQAKAQRSGTKFMAVRFGNVLGSSGSVVPLFKKQLLEGGPLTITHPEAERYFMSVKEAVGLVLQAAALGKGGEIFILDMGDQIKIVDIAKNLVALSGLVLNKDILVQFIGLRDGEKLSEELLVNTDKDIVTKHSKIYVSKLVDINTPTLRFELKELEKLSNLMDEQGIIKKMKEMLASH